MATLHGDSKAARRYAAALFDAVAADGGQGIDKTASDLAVVGDMLEHVKYLRAVLLQPLVSEERKRQVVDDAFKAQVGATTLNFLYLLIRKRREELMEAVIADFRRLADERAGRVEAHVEAPMPLSSDDLERLRAALEQRTGKQVRLHASVDESMIGGLRVRLGDSVIDGSLHARLERVRQQLLAAR